MLNSTANRRDFLRAVISGAAGLTISYRAFGQGAPRRSPPPSFPTTWRS